MTSKYSSILSAVQSTIQGLDLTDIDDANVVIGKLPLNRQGLLPELPGVVIAPFGAKTAPPTEGTNASDDITYPVVVATVQASNQSQTTNLDRTLQWHEDLMRAFIHQRLSGVASVFTCFVDPRDVFDPDAWFKGFDAGGMILRFKSRELRSS